MRLVPLRDLLTMPIGACTITGNVALWRWDARLSGLSQWGPNRDGDTERFFAFLDALLDDAGGGRFDFVADNLRMTPGDQDLTEFEDVHRGLLARRERIVARHRRMASVLTDDAMGLAIAAGQESVVRGAYEQRIFNAFGPALEWLGHEDAARIEAWLLALPETARAHGPVLAGVRDVLAVDAACSGPLLARHVGVSLRSLQRALAEAGTTLAQERNVARVHHAQSLLAEGDGKVEAVARAVGFRSVSHFIRVFYHITGETPGQVRSRSRPRR